MTESLITPGPFTADLHHDALRAQIETLNAITAYYASITATPVREFPEYVISAAQAKAAMSGQAGDILRKINDDPEFARGGVIYPTKVEIVDTSRGPEAGITFAWSPDQPHRLARNEVLELRDQLSQFLLDSAKQLSPEVKP